MCYGKKIAFAQNLIIFSSLYNIKHYSKHLAHSRSYIMHIIISHAALKPFLRGNMKGYQLFNSPKIITQSFDMHKYLTGFVSFGKDR